MFYVCYNHTMTTKFTHIQPEDIPANVKKILDGLEYDDNKKQNHIAITMWKKRIVSVGVNVYKKSHPLQAHYAAKSKLDNKNWLHAEISCLVKAKQKIDAIYVFRINKKGDLQYSAPCVICQAAIEEANIDCYHS